MTILEDEKICQNCEFADKIIGNEKCFRNFEKNEIIAVKNNTKSCKYFSESHEFSIRKTLSKNERKEIDGYG